MLLPVWVSNNSAFAGLLVESVFLSGPFPQNLDLAHLQFLQLSVSPLSALDFHPLPQRYLQFSTIFLQFFDSCRQNRRCMLSTVPNPSFTGRPLMWRKQHTKCGGRVSAHPKEAMAQWVDVGEMQSKEAWMTFSTNAKRNNE